METKSSTKKVIGIIGPREQHWVGDGFFVSTIFAVNSQIYPSISPFLLMDHAPAKYFAPTDKKLGVGEHPHRGFETVTFAIKGEVDHRDSGGGGGRITTGGVQWMTAASGVVHEEFHSRDFAKRGGEFEMVQLWVNLPAKDKMTKPRYQSMDQENFPVVSITKNVQARVVAGQLDGNSGPAKTFTPMNIYVIDVLEDDNFKLNLPDGSNTLIFQIHGNSKIQDNDMIERYLIVFDREGTEISIAGKKGAKLLVLNGEPINEPVAHYGPFVMNTKQEIAQAIADFEAGKMGRLVEEG